MKKLVYAITFLVIAAASAFGQRAPNRRIEADNSGYVKNEDQGQAYIVTANTKPLISFARRRIVNAPAQYTIFLGKGWADETLRQQEPQLANILGNLPGVNAVEDLGIRNAYEMNGYQENLIDLGSRTVSDIAIQDIVRGMLNDNSLPRPTSPTLFVIYIDPAADSALAAMDPGKHYLAYFNSFNIDGTRIRYVVVPMSANEKTALDTGSRAFLAAMYN